MKRMHIGSGQTIVAFAVFAVTSTLLRATVEQPVSFDKYRMILDRAPFGQPPKAPSDAEIAAALAQAAQTQPEEALPRLSDTISLNAMSRFRGVPAAGFLDRETGKSFFLTEGQTLGDFTLEEVSFETSSVILARGSQVEPIYLSYASGQATNLTQRADSHYLSVLNVQSHPDPTVTDTVSEIESVADSSERETVDGKAAIPAFTPEAIAAATTVDANGETRLSFRELHRLRVQQSKDKAEQERRELEARVKAERERSTAQSKEEAEQADMTAKVQAAAEALHRQQIIQAIKAGEAVEIDFELTPKEAKELAAAGFEISVEEIKSAESPDSATPYNKESAP